jgi:pimeloyl-ACP methyl ester carboxylesterase
MKQRRQVTAQHIVVLLLAATHHASRAEEPSSSAVVGDYLDVGGLRIFYEVRGDGPAVVLIHDGLVHRETWNDVWGPLAEGHRVVRYDRRGYGRSDVPTDGYFDKVDLHRLVKHLDLDNIVLVGSSAGSEIAMQYTLRWPEKVRALVLVGPVVSGFDFSDHFTQRNNAIFSSVDGPDAVEKTIDNWMADPFMIAPPNTVTKQRVKQLLMANPRNITRPWGMALRDDPALPRLGEIKVPALILVGEFDIPDVLAHAGVIQLGIKGSRRQIIVGAGHLPYLERPSDFTAAVKAFLQKLPS